MILDYPSTKPITTKMWFMIELRSEKTSEETIKRIGKSLKDIFGEDSAEVFIPVVKRDLDTFVLATESYVFVRADNANKVAKLRRVTGVQGILAKDESTRATKFLQVDDDYVQGLIRQCWEAHHRRAATIKKESWVRILDGHTRDYCGLVVAIDGDLALVRIDKKTKIVNVQTPVHNLLDLSHVPVEHRVFYYSDPVRTFLEEDGAQAEAAVGEDRAFSEDAVKAFLGTDDDDLVPPPSVKVDDRKHHASREQTPTRFVQGLILQGERDVKVLLAKTVEAIRKKTIRRPKTATILWHVIRETVVKHMFNDDPRVKTYTDISKLHGEAYELTPSDVAAAIPELPLRRGAVELEPPPPPPPAPAPKKEETMVIATVTSVVRDALVAKNYDLAGLIPDLEARLRSGDLRAPKHLESFTQAIRTQVLRHFRVSHPGSDIKTLAKDLHSGLHVTTQLLREKHSMLETLITEQRAKQFQPVQGTVVVKTMPGIIPQKPKAKPVQGTVVVKAVSEPQKPKARPSAPKATVVSIPLQKPKAKAKAKSAAKA